MELNLISTNTLPITKDLAGITSTGVGKLAEDARFADKAEALWRGALGYYKSGISPMVGLCVYDKSGKVIINRNIGHLDHTQTEVADIDTPVCLFSVSKMFTAFVIHKLAELGQLKLTDSVVRYLPRYTGGGKDVTTIRDLLTHHGGIPRLAKGDNKPLEPSLLFDREGIMDLLYRAPLISRDGATMAYHALSAGYLLGSIAETVAGKSLDDLLQTHFTKPMHMDCLHYGLPQHLRAKAAKNSVTGLHPKLGADMYITHVLSGGMQTAVEFTNHERFYEAFCPAGNVFATTENAARLMLMLLNGGVHEGKQILKPETVKAIRHAPFGWRFDYTLGVPMRYGQGVMFGATPVGLFGQRSARSFGHLGFTNIFVWADPKRGYAASFVNTGKAVVGTHLPSLVNVLYQVNRVMS